MHTATLHALPSCSTERIFELRRIALHQGIQYIPCRPRLAPKPSTSRPFGGDAA